jgi:hypothetical protein
MQLEHALQSRRGARPILTEAMSLDELAANGLDGVGSSMRALFASFGGGPQGIAGECARGLQIEGRLGAESVLTSAAAAAHGPNWGVPDR